jgi:hypothetical protein
MHDIHTSDQKIAIGAEFVPRFAQFLASRFVVPEGETMTLPPDATFDAIEVHGTLRVSRDYDTTMRFTHLFVMPMGYLDMGTAADPVMRRVDFIVQDRPLDSLHDPFQWGNAILNFGRWTSYGREMPRTFMPLAANAPAGATEITLSEDPIGWQVGDTLVLPDMRARSAEREYGTTIASINGRVLGLSKPLAFAREAIMCPEGTVPETGHFFPAEVVLMPRVANLSRNIVIRSENPSGTRGHSASVGHMAVQDLRYTQFFGMGRTTFHPLSNTTIAADGTVTNGANQIGKYATHFHHNGSSLEDRALVGNSYDGTFGSKWAGVVHVTHDALVKDNVAVDFQGGAFVTEDGPEVRNAFDRNFVAYSQGNGLNARQNTEGSGSPGAEGSGFWWRGIHNTFTRNEAFNNFIGQNIVNLNHVNPGTLVPSVRGGAADTVYDLVNAVPLAFDGAIGAANGSGIEFWAVGRFQVTNIIAAGNRTQVGVPISHMNGLDIKGAFLLGGNGEGTGIGSARGYTPFVYLEDVVIADCRYGTIEGVALDPVSFKNVRLQNVENLAFSPQPMSTRMENVIHVPLRDYPPRYVQFGSNWRWDGVSPIDSMLFFEDNFHTNQGSPHKIVNWQGTGKNYLLYDQFQLATEHAMYQARRPDAVPEAGLTVLQAWEKYGLAAGGGMVKPEDLVVLNGVTVGGSDTPAFAREGDADPLGQPRCVVQCPNILAAPVQRDPSRPEGPWALLSLQLTGDPTQADDTAYFAVNGGPTQRAEKSPYQPGGTRNSHVEGANLLPGLHTIVAWRQKDGAKVAGSEMTFTYRVPGEGEGPVPVDCVLGEWAVTSETAFSDWAPDAGGTTESRFKDVTETRAILTAPQNGGAPCGETTRTNRVVETRLVTPPTGVTWTTIYLIQQGSDGSVRVIPA